MIFSLCFFTFARVKKVLKLSQSRAESGKEKRCMYYFDRLDSRYASHAFTTSLKQLIANQSLNQSDQPSVMKWVKIVVNFVLTLNLVAMTALILWVLTLNDETTKTEKFHNDTVDRNISISIDPNVTSNLRKPDRCDLSHFLQYFKPEELEINCNNIHEVKIGSVLGKGGYGVVHAGKWHGQEVALKNPKPKVHRNDEDTLTRVKQVAAVMFQLREAPNVIRILGWCDKTIVMERAPQTLKSVLRQTLSTERYLKLSLDVFKGVQQIHTLPMGPVTHGDITHRQFVINEEGTVLLIDFSRVMYAGYTKSNIKCQFTRPKDGKIVDETYDVRRTVPVLQMLQAQVSMRDIPQAMKNLITNASRTKHTLSATGMVQHIDAILRDYEKSNNVSMN